MYKETGKETAKSAKTTKKRHTAAGRKMTRRFKFQFIALLFKDCHREPARRLVWRSPTNLRNVA